MTSHYHRGREIEYRCVASDRAEVERLLKGIKLE